MYDNSYIALGVLELVRDKEELTLADLKRGDSATVVNIRAEGTIRQRLLHFGFRLGETVKVVRLAPLADPMELSLKGGYLSLRRSEAALIDVRKTA